MRKAWCHIRWFLAVVPFTIISLTSFFIYPLAYLIEKKLPNNNPLWWWLDDAIDNEEEDWLIWLDNNGGVADFKTRYKWCAIRNKMWNANMLIKPKCGRINCVENREIITQVIQHTLHRNGESLPVDGKCLELGRLKWIDKNGNEGWQVNQGVKISRKFTTWGVSEIYYEVDGTLYYRYSRCFVTKILGTQYVLQIKYGTDHKGYLKAFKINKYEVITNRNTIEAT